MRNIYIIILILFSIPAFSQKTISGKIIDNTNGEPLPYAVIAENHHGIAVNSDKDGYFRISLPKQIDSLHISIIGYHAQSVAVSSIANPWIVRLDRGPVDLKSVTITPQSNNASFHTLSAIDLHIRPINSAQDLMRLVPGLFLGQHHGGGVAEHIFLRGFNADHGTAVEPGIPCPWAGLF